MAGATNQVMAAMTGTKGRLVVFQDGIRKLVDFETWSIKPNVTKHNDSINGAEFDELDFTFNFWEITGDLFNRDIIAVQTYLAALKVRVANTAPLVQQGGMRFFPNNGTKQSLVLVGLLWDDFDLKQGGRATKIKTTVNMRCTQVLEGKSV